MCISSHRDGWSAATGCRLLSVCRGGCGVCRNEKRLHVGPETAAAGRMCSQKDLQTSNVYGLDTPPCFRMPCQHFTATAAADRGRSEKACGGCDPAAGAPCPLLSPTNVKDTRMSAGITCRRLSNLFFSPYQGRSTRDVLAETATEQQGSPGLMHSGGRLIPGWLCRRDASATPWRRPAPCLTSAAAPPGPTQRAVQLPGQLHWPISIGRFRSASGRAGSELTSAGTSAKFPLRLLQMDRCRLESRRSGSERTLTAFSWFCN